jgi:hypothetical protein
MSKKLYRNLVVETLQFLQEQPKNTYFIADKQEAAFFSQPIKNLSLGFISPKPREISDEIEPKTLVKSPVLKKTSQQNPAVTLPAIPSKVPSDSAESVSKAPPLKQDSDRNSKTTTTKTPTIHIRATLEKIAPSIRLSDEPLDDAHAKRIASAWKEKVADAEVILLALDSTTETIEFLKSLAKAIHQELIPKMIQKSVTGPCQSPGIEIAREGDSIAEIQSPSLTTQSRELSLRPGNQFLNHFRYKATKVISGLRLEQEKKWDLFLTKNTFRLIIASHGIQQFPELMRYYKALPAQSQTFLGTIPLVTLLPTATYLQSLEQKALLWKHLKVLIS